MYYLQLTDGASNRKIAQTTIYYFLMNQMPLIKNGQIVETGEIWSYNDSQTALGTGKVRPCVIKKIIQVTPNYAIIRIVPLTEWKQHFSCNEQLIKVEPNESNCLKKVSTLDLSQEQPIPLAILRKHLGKLSQEEFEQMLDAMVLN